MPKKNKKFQRPWSFQLSPVEGCTRICHFCGIKRIRSGPGSMNFMSKAVYRRVSMGIAALNPQARIEIAMHGEPLAHPHLNDIIVTLRHFNPQAQIMLTTNGFRWVNSNQRMQTELELLFDLGLDIVVLDTYYPERDKLWHNAGQLERVHVIDFYGAGGKPSPWHNHRRKLRRTVFLMDDLGRRDGEIRSRIIFNHAGNAGPATTGPLHKTCTLPFRELSVAWDGDVLVCCMDWGHELVMGNVLEQSLAEIWYGSRFMAVRRFLGQKQRAFSPCSRCNHPSGSRAGLLPKLPPPTPEDARVIAEAIRQAEPRNGLAKYLGPEVIGKM